MLYRIKKRLRKFRLGKLINGAKVSFAIKLSLTEILEKTTFRIIDGNTKSFFIKLFCCNELFVC
jgi:hypothetical protein